jgi:hypothetical protein
MESLLFSVKYWVTLMRRQVYYPSGIDLSEDNWRRLLKAKYKELKQERLALQNCIYIPLCYPYSNNYYPVFR